MRRKSIISRVTTLVLATVVCLLLAVIVPVFLTQRATDDPFVANSVMALPRDMHVVTASVRLSRAPDLTLQRGVLYADGNAALGTPVSKFVLDGPVFHLNASGLNAAEAGHENSSDGGAIAPLLEQLAAMGFETLNIQRGTLYVTTTDGTSETISDLQAEFTGRRKGTIASRGSFILRGQRVAFDATLSPTTDKRAVLRWPMKISLRTGLLEASFDGHVDVAEDIKLSGQLDLSTSSIRRSVRWFGVPIPTASGLNAVALKGRFDWERRVLAIEEAKITVDGNEATGTLSLNLSGERPLMEGTLAFTALELSQYLEGARSQSLIFDRQTSSWSPFDLSFPILKHIDADLRVSTPTVAFKGHNLGRGAASITVRSGKLIANIAELEVPPGIASAQLTADMNGLLPHFTLRGKIENFEPGAAGAALFGAAVVSGRSTLTAELAADGQTPAEVLRRLSGKAVLAMPDGARMALDLKALRAVSKDNLAPGWGQLGKGQMSVDQVEAKAIIVDGVLIAEKMQARAGASVLDAAGSVDLAEHTLHLHLSVKPTAPADRPHKPTDPSSGAEVVSVRGPWQHPVVRAEDTATGAIPR